MTSKILKKIISQYHHPQKHNIIQTPQTYPETKIKGKDTINNNNNSSNNNNNNYYYYCYYFL